MCVCHFSQCQSQDEQFNLLLLLLVQLVSSCWSQQYNSDEEIYKEASSCKEILDKFPATPSGYYSLKTSMSKVYCDMDTEHCGVKGWRRVAYIDMSNNLQSCPGDLNVINAPIRTCGSLTVPGCASANFSTHGISYSKVCGRLKGYQVGHTDAFGSYVNDQTNLDLVVDGVLISQGQTKSYLGIHHWKSQNAITR